MSKTVAISLILAASELAVAGPVDSFELVSDGWFYRERNLIGHRLDEAGGLADYVDNGSMGGVNHMWQNWWWYRSAGDAREFGLSNQTGSTTFPDEPNKISLRYLEPTAAGGNLVIDLSYILTGGATDANLTINFAIQNGTPRTETVNFFGYFDMDLSATPLNDQAVSNLASSLVFEGASTNRGKFLQTGAAAWEVAAFSGIRDKLVNGVVDGLANAVSPFGPADYTGAYQWTLAIPAGQIKSGSLRKVLSVPEPSTLAFIFLLALPIPRRRKPNHD